MKKLVLFTAVIVAVAFSACKNTTTEEAPAVEEITVVEEIPVEEVDAVEVDAVAEEAAE